MCIIKAPQIADSTDLFFKYQLCLSDSEMILSAFGVINGPDHVTMELF